MDEQAVPPQGNVEDIRESLSKGGRALAAEQAEQKLEYERVVSSVATLPPQEKAVEWLSYSAHHRQEDCDLESLVFLASRGCDVKNEIVQVIGEWKRAEQETLEQYNAHLQQRSNQSSPITIRDVATCEGDLSNFWYGLNLTIDATMLRTVGWCRIGGFEHWWERIAKVMTGDILANCWGGTQGAFLLFAMCRSELARKLLATALRHLYDLILHVDYRVPLPGRTGAEEVQTMADNIACLSAIIFSGQQLQLACGQEDDAVRRILREYDQGAWRMWPEDESPSIEATAMAMHALAMKQPHGWEHMMAGASAWLLDKQNPEGYWDEPGAPEPIYLTVLAMDALNLAAGSPFPPTFATPPTSRMLVITSNTIDPTQPESAAEGTCSRVDSAMTRKERVLAYIAEVEKLTGQRITKTEIWRAAGYKSRTEFERWERKDIRATSAADQNISRVLREKPHIKKYLE